MKRKLLFMGAVVLFATAMFTSCTTTIPLRANLDDQTMLMAENKMIKANYELSSQVNDGYIGYTHVLRDGSTSDYSTSYKYLSKTAFNKIWKSYFSTKFSKYAKDEMDVFVELRELKLQENKTTSIGYTMLTGNTKSNVEAVSTVYVRINYKGETYEEEFEITTSDYQESQTNNYGGITLTHNHANPTQQKSRLLESCLNKSVIQFENFVQSILNIHASK